MLLNNYREKHASVKKKKATDPDQG